MQETINSFGFDQLYKKLFVEGTAPEKLCTDCTIGFNVLIMFKINVIWFTFCDKFVNSTKVLVPLDNQEFEGVSLSLKMCGTHVIKLNSNMIIICSLGERPSL